MGFLSERLKETEIWEFLSKLRWKPVALLWVQEFRKQEDMQKWLSVIIAGTEKQEVGDCTVFLWSLLFCAVVDTESTVYKTLSAFTRGPRVSQALGSAANLALVFILSQ